MDSYIASKEYIAYCDSPRTGLQDPSLPGRMPIDFTITSENSLTYLWLGQFFAGRFAIGFTEACQLQEGC